MEVKASTPTQAFYLHNTTKAGEEKESDGAAR